MWVVGMYMWFLICGFEGERGWKDARVQWARGVVDIYHKHHVASASVPPTY